MESLFQQREFAEALGLVIFILTFAAAWGLAALVRRADKEVWRE
ncbi:MAG: hypothetical protein SVS15_11325 [Thermodesulfobacteriota bacterium]|nr:hypothetical protein [Thermodesulfobacteriota bacterium]